MYKEIKEIDKKSFAKIFGLLYGLGGFIVAVSLSIAGTIDTVLRASVNEPKFIALVANASIGILMSALVGVVVGIFGFTEGYVVAMFYNVFARKFGGVKTDIDDARRE